MYVKAMLAMAVDEQALLVPQQAVTRDSKGDATVLLVDAGGKVEQRTIHVGDAVKDRWRVLSGLKAGDRVIVQGMQKARAGATVKTIEVDPSRPAISTPPAVATPAKPR
jgi:multidrug efflux system membrane fusion protein